MWIRDFLRADSELCILETTVYDLIQDHESSNEYRSWSIVIEATPPIVLLIEHIYKACVDL